MDIKRIKPSDKDKLRKLLYDFHINNRIKTFSKELQELEKYKDNNQTIDKSVDDYLNDPKYIVYIAEENDEPLGFIAGNVVEKPQKVLDKRGYIEDWFVIEKFRNKNIGKELFDKLIEDFKNLGCKAITLDAFAENRLALDIYHHMGFKDRGINLIKRIV